MVIEDAIEFEDSGVIGLVLLKWAKLREPSPWVDWLFPWGDANSDSNWGLGKLCRSTVKDRDYYLYFSKMG